MFIKFPPFSGNFFMSNKFNKLKKRISNLTERKKGQSTIFQSITPCRDLGRVTIAETV